MKKITLTLIFILGYSITSFACDAAWKNLLYEVEQFGKFDTYEEAMEAFIQWHEISC